MLCCVFNISFLHFTEVILIYGSHFYLRKCHAEVKLLFPYTEVDFRKCICKTEVDFRKTSEILRKSIFFSFYGSRLPKMYV